MAPTPHTERYDTNADGNPEKCIHLTDEDGDRMAVHPRTERLGYLLTLEGTAAVVLPGGAVAQADVVKSVWLTRDQAQQLCTYFRDTL